MTVIRMIVIRMIVIRILVITLTVMAYWASEWQLSEYLLLECHSELSKWHMEEWHSTEYHLAFRRVAIISVKEHCNALSKHNVIIPSIEAFSRMSLTIMIFRRTTFSQITFWRMTIWRKNINSTTQQNSIINYKHFILLWTILPNGRFFLIWA